MDRKSKENTKKVHGIETEMIKLLDFRLAVYISILLGDFVM